MVGTSFAQQAGTQAVTMCDTQGSQGSCTHQETLTGGGGAQQAGSGQQFLENRPKHPASADAVVIMSTAATAPLAINPRRKFIVATLW